MSRVSKWDELLLKATVSASGLDITIACDDASTRDQILDLLLTDALDWLHGRDGTPDAVGSVGETKT